MKKAARLLALILSLLMLLCAFPALAEETPAASPEATEAPTPTPEPTITTACALTLPESMAGKAYRLLDAYVESYVPLAAGESLLVELPEAAQGLYLEWYAPTEAYQIEELSAAGAALGTQAALPYINSYYPLQPDTRALRVTALEACSLSGLRVYAAEAELPPDLQLWQAPAESPDLAFLAATTEAALTEYFAAIAIYAVEHEVETAILCLSVETRAMQNDFLAALWALGVRQYPYFGGFFSWNNGSYRMVNAEWGAKNLKNWLEALLPALSPRVLVCHADDEDAANQAAYYTTDQLLQLLDNSKSPLSELPLEKLYLTAAEGTTLDLDAPLISRNGATARQSVEETAFEAFTSLHDRPEGVTARASFALHSSRVGEDAQGTDLLENIPQESLRRYAAPTATPEP
ncbi:MAG: hypothetical protein Q4C13_08620, partial [Clostridia bacterium]|nr:hypothetical protein [Clostridia bacterium]